MLFGNREKIEELLKSVLSQFKKISPLWKPEIKKFRHFSKLKISFFNETNPSNFSLPITAQSILSEIQLMRN